MAKKILLSLIFSLSFTLTIFYLIESILITVKPSWVEHDAVNINNTMWWIVFGLFLLSALSSFAWLINLGSGFWLWKIPALLILPFSIPFLIIDYLEFKKGQKAPKMSTENEKKTFLIILIVVVCFNLFIIILQIDFLKIPIAISAWFWFLILIPVSILSGSASLILNYFHPKKILIWLSYLGLTLNWVYLFLKIIDKKQINYFFKSKNIEN